MTLRTAPPPVGLYVDKAFSAHIDHQEVAPGTTVARMITEAINAGRLDPDDLELVRVYVNGEPLPSATPEERAAVLDVVPAAGAVVNLSVEPEGGSNADARSGTALLFQVIGTIASFTVGPFTAAMWFLAAAVVPNILFPIKTPDSLEGGANKGLLNQQSNPLRPRQMMPLQCGAAREVLDVAAQPYSQLRDGDIWLHLILGAHYGPCSIDDIKIGETMLADYPAADVRIVQHLLPGPRNFTIYPAQVEQESFQDQLDLGGAFEVHTTDTKCERVELDFAWPSGLQFNKSNGSILQQETRLQIEWQPLDAGGNPTGPYVAAPLSGGPFKNRQGANLPTGQVDIMARSKDPVYRTLSWNTGGAGQYNVRAKAWDPDNDDPNKAVQDVYWTAVRTIRSGKPILDEYLSVIELAIRSSDDLSGALPAVSALITPHAPVWTGSEWLDDIEDWQPTSNMAAVSRMMLLGPGAARPHTADMFDASCADMYELIEEMGWKGGYRIAQDVTQETALKVMGAIGRFNCYDAGEGLCYVPHWEKPISKQLFTGRNVQGYRFTRAFADPVHAVVVEFRNANEDGEPDEVIVYMDGYSEDGTEPDTEPASLFESLTLEYQCEPDRAVKEGRNFLTRRVHQVETHEWTAYLDSLRSTVGDRVKVRHQSALFGIGDGRVQHRHFSGALVSGVRLEEPVRMESGKSYALDVRSADVLIPGLAVVTNPGLQRDLYFAAPLAVAAAPEQGDLIAFGEVGAVTEDVELVDVDPQPDGTARMKALRYIAAELEAAESGPIAPFVTRVTARPRAPVPRIIGEPEATPDGARVAFDVDPVRGGAVSGFAVRWRITPTAEADGQWNALAPLPASSRGVTTPPISSVAAPADLAEAEVRIDVEIRSILPGDKASEPAYALGILVHRVVAEPEGFDALGVTRAAPDGTSRGVIEVWCDAVPAGLIQDLVVEVKAHGAADSTYVSAGQPLPASNPKGDYPGAGGRNHDLRAAWRTSDGWMSSWVEKLNVIVPSGSDVASDLTPDSPVREMLDQLQQTYGDTASAAASAADAAASAAAAAAAQIAAAASEAAAATAASDAIQAEADAVIAQGAAQGAATAAASDALAAASSAGTAGTSASEAATSASSAAAAEAAAIVALGEAQTSATEAASSATAAAGSAGNALTSANSAATSATNASSSATTAAGHASSASTSAGAAATSATSAGNSATAAAGSASSASTSATNAGNSATAAQASSVSAQSVANRLIPERASVAADFTGSFSSNGAPDAQPALAWGTVVTAPGEGSVRQVTTAAGYVDLVTRGALSVVAGRSYRLSHRTHVTVDAAGTNRLLAYWRVYDANWSYLGVVAASASAYDTSHTFADGWQTRSAEITAAAILSAYPTAAHVRGDIRIGENGSSGGSGATIQVAFLKLQDITSEAASAAAASAAASSASSAATSATSAGTSASAANTSATSAATSAGNASTSASQASNSASTAAGHASTASTAATNAANSATSAGNSASAASGSASTAATHATNAGNSATAAANSAVSAQSAFENAEDAADAAANSASAASTSASAASTSAGAAGSSASAAQTSATNAATSAGNASTSATQASNSATTASGHAANAATSAGAAATSATNAGNSASAAAGSASSAATQATSAGNSATAAAASVVSAQSVATRLVPERVATGADFAAAFSPGNPFGAWTDLAWGSVVTATGEGQVRQHAGNADATTRGALPVVAGRRYRASARGRVLTDAASGDQRRNIWFRVFDASWAYLGVAPSSDTYSPWTFAQGWVTRSAEVTAADILAAYPTAAHVRANSRWDSLATGLTYQVAFVRLEDITSEAAAAGSASAAATSASSAATSATNAGNSASAAQTSATSAATSAGQASTSATQASNSATTASGHASTASTASTAAANSATSAGNSATAASGSASTAATHATNAGNSATAAANSAVAAESAFEDAEAEADAAASSASAAATSASNASTSATAAASSASSASTSATNAATSAGNASTSATQASNSATSASGHASNASNSATAAANSATAAGNSASAASGSANTASTAATNAGNSATAASASAVSAQSAFEDAEDEAAAAASSASAASTSASSAATSATNAGTSASAASASATTANTAASNASTHASSASTSAGQAASSASAASTSASNASGSAATASTAASNASSAATQAAQSALVAASLGTAALNPNPVFADYPSTPGYPAGWVAWLGATPTRVAGDVSPYAMRIVGAAGADAGAAMPPAAGMLDIRADAYLVIEADAVLVSGALTGAGVVVVLSSAANVAVESLFLSFSTEKEPGAAAVAGVGTVGRTHRFRKLVKVTHPDAAKATLYAMAHYSPLGSTAEANSIDFRKVAARQASTEEVAAGTALPPLQASVAAHSSALVVLEGERAEARFGLVASATGGRPARFGLISTNHSASGIALDADQIWFGDNTHFDDAYDVFITDDGGSRLITHGPFGVDGDLLMWSGPDTVAPNAATKANAAFFLSSSEPRIGGNDLTTDPGPSGDVAVEKRVLGTTLSLTNTTKQTAVTVPFTAMPTDPALEITYESLSFIGGTGSEPDTVLGWDWCEVQGGTTTVLKSGTIWFIDDGLGGYYAESQNSDPMMAYVGPGALEGTVSYILRLWKVSGSNYSWPQVYGRVKGTPTS